MVTQYNRFTICNSFFLYQQLSKSYNQVFLRFLFNVILTLIIGISVCTELRAEQSFSWPNNKIAAVSLAYDDALDSQLDNAIPALNKHDFKGSFYLSLASPNIRHRLKDWRKAARQGHELGNHTINHACRASLPNRDWVASHNDLDNRSLKQIIQEVKNANSFLHAIDGETIRTFTVPCTDLIVENQNYAELIAPLFVGIKYSIGKVPTKKSELDMLKMPFIAPVNVSDETLIGFVKEAKKHGTMVNFTFHGIGGDHLSVSKKAHEKLLTYLAENKSDYWVDTYRNISLYVHQKVRVSTVK